MTLPAAARTRLITVRDYRASGGDPRDLRVGVRGGRLVRVRRGTYCYAGDWQQADERSRHLIAVRAAVDDARGSFLVCDGSAGAVWGLPYAARWPADVSLLVRERRGGTSEPGVRQTTVSADEGFRTGTRVDGIPVTSLARTALDIARRLPFARAVAVVDAAIARRNPLATMREELEEVLRRSAYVRGARHLARVVAFASPLSDSPKESEARAVIHELGFEAPELQAVFVDEEGEMRSDFWWRSVGKVGELDGKVKYTRAEYTGGDPSEVVWREKQREDRLRRQPDVTGVLRILSEHVDNPERLDALLTRAGIPRERGGYSTS